MLRDCSEDSNLLLEHCRVFRRGHNKELYLSVTVMRNDVVCKFDHEDTTIRLSLFLCGVEIHSLPCPLPHAVPRGSPRSCLSHTVPPGDYRSSLRHHQILSSVHVLLVLVVAWMCCVVLKCLKVLVRIRVIVERVVVVVCVVFESMIIVDWVLVLFGLEYVKCVV